MSGRFAERTGVSDIRYAQPDDHFCCVCTRKTPRRNLFDAIKCSRILTERYKKRLDQYVKKLDLSSWNTQKSSPFQSDQWSA
jgi:ribosomal protein L37AE/L43A